MGGGARAVAQDFDYPVGLTQGGLYRVVEPAAIGGLHYEPVNDQCDIMVLPPIELGHIGEVMHLAVHTDAHEAAATGVVQQLAKLALPAPHQRRQYLDAGALGPSEHGIDDLRCALPRDR